MTLQLLICTFNDGILQIPSMLLPPMAEVSYLVSWQQGDGYVPCAVPEALLRPDVQLFRLEGLGLSRNRNHSLRHATADVCLICDDDCRYTQAGLLAVKRTFERDANLDLAAFKSVRSADARCYPAREVDLSQKTKNYSPSSIELALRRSSFAGRIAFNEHFGLGSDLFGMGEEEWLLQDAIDAGLKCRFFPIEVVAHEGITTTVSRAAEPAVLMTYGAILLRKYRGTLVLRAPLIAWRQRRNGVPFFFALRCIFGGVAKAWRLL